MKIFTALMVMLICVIMVGSWFVLPIRLAGSAKTSRLRFISTAAVVWAKTSRLRFINTAAVACCVPVSEESLLIEGKSSETNNWATRIRHRWLQITAGTVSGLVLLCCAGYLIRFSERRNSETELKNKPQPWKRKKGKE